jgi:hypothetical protein
MMRLTTQNVALLQDDEGEEGGEEAAPQISKKDHIISRRGAFKWLPGEAYIRSSSSSSPFSDDYSFLFLNSLLFD